MFNSFPGSLHSDVLNAVPNTNEEKSRLVDELRSRAKGSISSKNYPEAIQLYTKALEIIPTDDKNGIAILHGNISMCYLGMSKVNDAIKSANDSIKNDNQYVKAYYRKAMAYINQKDYNQAKEALLDGLKIKPDDKEIITQLDKVQTEIIKNGNIVSSSSSSSTTTTTTTTTKISASSPSSSSSSTTTTTTKTAAAPITTSSNSDSMIENDEEGQIMRGYKIIDGKKTTFFNHELDAKTKELIGDIQPKRIESTNEVDTKKNPVGTSVWNTAGTFESVGHTPWAKETLEKLLKDIKLDTGNTVVTIIKEVKDICGDAEITSNRGKRKHIYDFSIKLIFSIIMNENTNYDGEIKIDDVTADDCDFEFSVSYDKNNSNYNADIEKIISSQVKSTNGLKPVIIDRLKFFDKEFKSK